MNIVDNVVEYIAPRTALKRKQARELLSRSYDAASTKKRVSDWKVVNSSANTEIGQSLVTIRNRARDLRRNNCYANKIISSIASNVIGTGILPSCPDPNFLSIYNTWADSTKCDSNGKRNFYGIQKLCFESLVESGEVLILKQYKKSKDGLTIPLQLKVLESDYLDTSKNSPKDNLIQGVQFDNTGNITGYWIFQNHPGDSQSASKLIKVSEIIHLFKAERPGQVRGMSWLAPVIIPLKKLSDFEDALLEKQLISNLFAGFIYDTNDSGGAVSSDAITLEPGSLVQLASGKQIDFSTPPTANIPDQYLNHVLRAIACGVGIPYEILTGNLSEVNFSSARISWGEFQRLIDDYRWNTFIPQFLDIIWSWLFDSATLSGFYRGEMPKCLWTPPRRVMVSLEREVPAILSMIRGGLITPSEAIREQGYNPEEFFEEYAKDLQKLDELKIMLETDVRKDSERKVKV